jgi:hypothetical protein
MKINKSENQAKRAVKGTGDREEGEDRERG